MVQHYTKFKDQQQASTCLQQSSRHPAAKTAGLRVVASLLGRANKSRDDVGVGSRLSHNLTRIFHHIRVNGSGLWNVHVPM
jgi:hypothetical protein